MTDLLTPITLVRPGKIEFGPGTANRVGQWARDRGLERILVICDPFNRARIDRLELPGTPAVYGAARAEPDIDDLARLLDMAEVVQPDLIVGFGGGSAMDVAKLASVLVGSTLSVGDIVGLGKAPRRRIKLIQVPTTAGTGSEAGTRALVSDPVSRTKLAIDSVEMLADLAVIDPSLTHSVPAAITAATGVDALAHCVEAYTSRRSHPTIDAYALQGITLVGRYLARAVADGQDSEARAGMALASLYGGFCLGPVNTTAGHAVSYPLGTRHGIAHGVANALIFPHALAFNARAQPEKTRHVLAALALPEDLAEEQVRAAASAYCANLGIDMQLADHGVPRDDLTVMADEAITIRRLLDFNPREMTRDDIFSIYETAY